MSPFGCGMNAALRFEKQYFTMIRKLFLIAFILLFLHYSSGYPQAASAQTLSFLPFKKLILDYQVEQLSSTGMILNRATMAVQTILVHI